ncbi:MAG: hypothetical protein KDB80_04685, partial [Planctomycetes bacterium]|nr:hypothetical protein [Planctomycetota bacterium]
MTRSWTPSLASIVLVAVSTGFVGCRGDEQAAEHRDGPSAPDAILEFDGVAILRRDVERWIPYLESWDPRSGPKSRMRAALRHVIPIAMARR